MTDVRRVISSCINDNYWKIVVDDNDEELTIERWQATDNDDDDEKGMVSYCWLGKD